MPPVASEALPNVLNSCVQSAGAKAPLETTDQTSPTTVRLNTFRSQASTLVEAPADPERLCTPGSAPTSAVGSEKLPVKRDVEVEKADVACNSQGQFQKGEQAASSQPQSNGPDSRETKKQEPSLVGTVTPSMGASSGRSGSGSCTAVLNGKKMGTKPNAALPVAATSVSIRRSRKVRRQTAQPASNSPTPTREMPSWCSNR